jgi:NADPH-dependent ferric siderophore reductase
MFGGRLKGSYLLDLEVVGIDEVATHVRLITMASSDLVGFEYTPGQDLLFEFPDGDRGRRRRYTIRRSDPAEGTADFEIEIHDGRGPATRWAANAKAGRAPRGHRAPRRYQPATNGHVPSPRCRRLRNASRLRPARSAPPGHAGHRRPRDESRREIAPGVG